MDIDYPEGQNFEVYTTALWRRTHAIVSIFWYARVAAVLFGLALHDVFRCRIRKFLKI